jgi:8-oxo-dGTP diphosphatase
MSQRNPFPTVDVVVECQGGIVLVRRRNEPVGWALPGGFVDAGERVEAAAVREIAEETGLAVTLETLLYVYSNPARDPRFHTLTVAFIGQAAGQPAGADDAAEAHVFALDALPTPIVFDHAQIIEDYLRYRASGERPSPSDALGR